MVNKIIIIVSLIVLISVHIIEIIGFPACDLCLKQRWAWYLALIIASIPLIVTINFNKILLSVISIVLFCNAIFAGWHAGIEWDLWSGLTTCNSNAIFDSNNLLETLKESSVPVCDDASIRIFGISLAGYNFIVSLLTSIFVLITLRKENGSKETK